MASTDELAAPLHSLAGAETAPLSLTTYGGLKVACERALDEELAGRVQHVRAGLILDPHDYDAPEPEVSRREHREVDRAPNDVASEADGEKDRDRAVLPLLSRRYPGQDHRGNRGEVHGALLNGEGRERARDPARHPPRLPRGLLLRRSCFDLIDGAIQEICRSRILWAVWVGGN